MTDLEFDEINDLPSNNLIARIKFGESYRLLVDCLLNSNSKL